MIRYSFILVFFSCFYAHRTIGQQEDFPIRKWISQLSSKPDPAFTDYNEIGTFISKQDSADKCYIWEQLYTQGPAHHKRYQIMMGVLESALIIGGNKCTSLPSPADMEPKLKNTLIEAYVIILLASGMGYLWLNRQRLRYKYQQKEAL